MIVKIAGGAPEFDPFWSPNLMSHQHMNNGMSGDRIFFRYSMTDLVTYRSGLEKNILTLMKKSAL